MKFMMKINDGRVGTLLCPRGYQTAWADDKPVCPRYSLSTNLPWQRARIMRTVGPNVNHLRRACHEDPFTYRSVMDASKQTDASKALLDFLSTPEAAAVIKAKGMEPATP